jgi:precorrin-2 dehydrogenase/sirohydrochlorin ferrochelatase
VSVLPIALAGERVRAVVIGGGVVGTRKALALLEAGAHVRVVAPEVTPELASASRGGRLVVSLAPYTTETLDDSTVVIAATNSRDINSRVAADARRRGKLVNVVDSPEDSDFYSMAVHRAGELTVGVSTGGVPGAAVRIRDAIAARFDARYENALSALRELRQRLLVSRDDTWQRAATKLIADDFCDAVETGALPKKVATWR